MGRVFVFVLTVLVFSSGLLVGAQSPLPTPEQAVILGVKSSRQRTPQGPHEFTLASDTRITVPAGDIHESATALVRSEVAKQALQPIDPTLVFVVQIQKLAPAGSTHVAVTLLSGAVVRIRSGDVYDHRLTFLRTALAEAVARERAERAERVRAAVTEYLQTISARIGEKWDRNQGIAGKVKMKFVVHRDGRITNIEVEESGGEVLDLAAVKALTVTRQVQPLPPEFPDNTLPVQLMFEYVR